MSHALVNMLQKLCQQGLREYSWRQGALLATLRSREGVQRVCSWPWYVPCVFVRLYPDFLQTLQLTLRPFNEGCRNRKQLIGLVAPRGRLYTIKFIPETSDVFFLKDYSNRNRKQLVPAVVSFAKQGTETETTYGPGRPARPLEANAAIFFWEKVAHQRVCLLEFWIKLNWIFQGFIDPKNVFSDAEVLDFWPIYVQGVKYLTSVCVMYVMMYVVSCRAKRRAGLPVSASAPRTVAAAPSFQACLRACICKFCICMCICMCVCVRTCIYVYICMYVCICICMCSYTFVCVCVCIFVHRLWVSVSVLQRVDGVMHAHVCSSA